MQISTILMLMSLSLSIFCAQLTLLHNANTNYNYGLQNNEVDFLFTIQYSHLISYVEFCRWFLIWSEY